MNIPTLQPEALRIAAVLEGKPGYDFDKTYCEAVFQLRHLHNQNECLKAENECLKIELITLQANSEINKTLS